MTTTLEGVLTIKKEGLLIGVVHTDPTTHKKIFYSCKEMGLEDLKDLLVDAQYEVSEIK